jgi:hypothetical protein
MKKLIKKIRRFTKKYALTPEQADQIKFPCC